MEICIKCLNCSKCSIKLVQTTNVHLDKTEIYSLCDECAEGLDKFLKPKTKELVREYIGKKNG